MRLTYVFLMCPKRGVLCLSTHEVPAILAGPMGTHSGIAIYFETCVGASPLSLQPAHLRAHLEKQKCR